MRCGQFLGTGTCRIGCMEEVRSTLGLDRDGALHFAEGEGGESVYRGDPDEIDCSALSDCPDEEDAADRAVATLLVA